MRRAGSRRRALGFTLIELAVVVVVLGILASVAVPVVGRIQQIRADSAVTTLTDHLRYVQSLAMATHRCTWVVFDMGSHRYDAYIEDPNVAGRAHRVPVTDPLTRAELSVTLGEGFLAGVQLASVDFDGGAEVEFSSTGEPRDVTGALLTTGIVTFSSGESVTVTPETGCPEIGP